MSLIYKPSTKGKESSLTTTIKATRGNKQTNKKWNSRPRHSLIFSTFHCVSYPGRKPELSTFLYCSDLNSVQRSISFFAASTHVPSQNLLYRAKNILWAKDTHLPLIFSNFIYFSQNLRGQMTSDSIDLAYNSTLKAHTTQPGILWCLHVRTSFCENQHQQIHTLCYLSQLVSLLHVDVIDWPYYGKYA